MGFSPDVLGPNARAYYDRQKRCVVHPPSARPSAPARPPSTGTLAPGTPSTNAHRRLMSERTKASIRGEKADAEQFENICRKAMLPQVVRQFRFHPTRLWRFDYAFPSAKIAVEVDGGVFVQGRHNTGVGYKKDMEKNNSAVIMGWRILRVTPSQLLHYETVEMVIRAMRGAKS